MSVASFSVSFARLSFQNKPFRFGVYSGILAVYLDAESVLLVSRGTWNRPITSVVFRPARTDAIGTPVKVFVRNETGKPISKITARPLFNNLGANRVAFAKDFGGKPLEFSVPASEAVVFEGMLHAGQIVPFWVRFEVTASDIEDISDFQIELVAEMKD